MPATDYTPSSALGWFDHDERDAERMRALVAAFAESETVDSLGLGVIRDALAEQLFPATSTIQTRARYFCFVPWILRDLERAGVGPATFDRELRTREVKIIKGLRAGTDAVNAGVIGARVGDRIKQLPTAIYWNGLGRLGIRRAEVSIAQYRQRIRLFARARHQVLRDDDGEPVGAVPQVWDPHAPDPPSGLFSEPLTLELEGPEADYLADRIRQSCQGSLLAEMVRAPVCFEGADAPWTVTRAGFDAELCRILDHAQRFSQVTHGARLLYNLALADQARELLGRDTAALVESVRGRLDEWGHALAADRTAVEAWAKDIGEFWYVVAREGPVPMPARQFVAAWTRLALDEPARIADDPAARALVVRRERALKGRRARLSNRRALENWNGVPRGDDPLLFRWPIARTIVRDITLAQPGVR